MRLLRDTNALVWWLVDEKLSQAARRAIENPRAAVIVSAVSALEVALKVSLGTMIPPETVGAAVDAQGFRRLPVTFEHAEAVAALPSTTRTPSTGSWSRRRSSSGSRSSPATRRSTRTTSTCSGADGPTCFSTSR